MVVGGLFRVTQLLLELLNEIPRNTEILPWCLQVTENVSNSERPQEVVVRKEC